MSKIKALAGLVLLRAVREDPSRSVSLACHFFPGFPHLPSVYVWVQISPFYKDTSQIGLRPTLRMSF